MIGEHRDERLERARGIPRTKRLRVVVEQREEDLLDHVLHLLRDASRTVHSPHQRARDPHLDRRPQTDNQRAHRFRVARDRTTYEVVVAHRAVSTMLACCRGNASVAGVRRTGMFYGMLCMSLLACRHDTKKSEPTFAPLAAEFAGCAGVRKGGICELPRDRAIRVFVPGGGDLAFFGDQTKIEAAVARTLPEGRLFRVTLPEGAMSLRVERGNERFTLALAPHAQQWVLDARAIRAKDPEAARLAASAHLSAKDPAERALAVGLTARIALSRGQVEDAIAKLRESSALLATTDRVSDRADDTFALAFALNQRSHRYDEARTVLDALDLTDFPEGRAQLPFYRAELWLETGDLRRALRGLDDAHHRAARLGRIQLERDARALLASVQQDLGDDDVGIATLTALDAEVSADPTAPGCQRAGVLANLALSLDRRDEVRRSLGLAAPNDALRATAARLSALFPDTCGDPSLAVVAWNVVASSALADGNTDAATAAVDHAHKTLKEPRTNDVLQRLELEGRIALRRGEAERARARFDEEATLAAAAQVDDILWRALVGRSEAFIALGKRPQALEDLLRAERLLDGVTLGLPLSESRGRYLSRSEKSARLALDLLLSAGKTREAFALARRARSRALSSTASGLAVEALPVERRREWETALAAIRAERAALDLAARDDWKLSAVDLERARAERSARFAALRTKLDDALHALGTVKGELQAPAPGELWLAFHRTPREWIAFAATDRSVETTPMAAEDLAAVIAYFAPAVRAASRIVVLPYGPVRAIDVHALAFDGAPLIARAPVEYALDVPRRTPAEHGACTVGLVSDPLGDLPESAREAAAIAKVFEGGACIVRALRGAEATPRAVLEMFAVDTLHYAGHGAFAGVDGVESRLSLAGGELGVVDILAARAVPRRVVLSACESGRTRLDVMPETLGLAHAFLLAGSDAAVAPTRAVPDALAGQVGIALHKELQREPDVAKSFRAAMLATRAKDPSADWPAWRAFRP